MKIFYDHQTFTLQKYGGISRYFYETIKQLKKKDNVEIVLPLRFTQNEYLINDPSYSGIIRLSKRKFPFKRMIVKYLNKKNVKSSFKAIRSENFDIYHPTFFDPSLAHENLKKPMVLTVYDMITEVLEANYNFKPERSHHKKIMADKAARIIAISKHTKKNIIKYFGIPDDKIDVIYLGSSLAYNGFSQNSNLPKNYILYVGNRNKYKNFNTFIESVAPLLKKDNSLMVIAAGAKPFKKEEVDFLAGLGINSQVIHKPVYDDYTLSLLYGNARVFAFPSLYEGFGIPVLEAFGCRCPAVISNTSSLVEVGGDAVKYFDPKSHASIRNTIEEVVYNESLRRNLILKGVERLPQFTWEETANKTLDVYKLLS